LFTFTATTDVPYHVRQKQFGRNGLSCGFCQPWLWLVLLLLLLLTSQISSHIEYLIQTFDKRAPAAAVARQRKTPQS